MSGEFNLDCIKFKTTFEKLPESKVDKNNDGRIDKDEKQGYIDFLGKLKADNELSESDYNIEMSVFKEAFGEATDDAGDTFKSNQSVTTPTGIETRGTKKHFNKDLKDLYKVGYSMQDAIDRLEERSYNDPGSKEMLNTVKGMVEFIQSQNITSKSDIRALKRKQFDYPIKYRAIFNTLVDKAKDDLKNSHVNEMKEEYVELRDKIESGTEINYSELKTQAEANATSKNGRKYTYKERKAFKKYLIGQAKDNIYFTKMQNTTGHTGAAVAKELRQANASDKIEKAAIRKIRTTLKTQGYINKADYRMESKIASVSRDELINGIRNDKSKGDYSLKSQSALGKELFHKLERSYLSKHDNGNGTYDLTEIYNIVKYRIGADANANRSKDLRMAEMQHIKEDLEALGITDLSKTDVQHIIRLCGFHVENRDHLGAILPISTGIANVIADAFILGKSTNVPVKYNITADVLVQILAQIETDLPEGVLVDLSGDLELLERIQEKVGAIEDLIEEPMKTVRAISASVGAANFLLSVLLPLAIGKEQEFEKSCVSISDFDLDNERYTNYKEYEKYIKDKYIKEPKKAGALLAIAAMYTDDNGKIDVGRLSSALNRIAGVGSNLNCQELHQGYMEVERKQKEKQDDNTVVIADHCEEVQVEIPETKVEKIEVPTINGRSSSWPLIAGSYPCLVQKYGLSKTIRMIKLAQAINDNNYSTERMERLLNMSYNNVSALKQEEGFNYNTYYNMLTATCLSSSVKVPDNLADCDRDTNKNLKARRGNIKITGRSQVRKPGKSEVDYAKVIRVRTETEDQCTYGARYNKGEAVYYPSREDRDNAVAEYKKNNPKSTIEKVEWEDFKRS